MRRRPSLVFLLCAATLGAPTNRARAQAVPTIRPHPLTLAECLALADRNFPNLWAARARLALAHAQLAEAKWTPWFQWSAQSSFGVAPAGGGTVLYTSFTLANRNIDTAGNLPKPFIGLGVSGSVPLYTFGKIENAAAAAEANVRVSEWDLEKARQQMRLDVRRAYYGLQLARDAMAVVTEAIERIDRGIQGLRDKLAKGDASVTEIDRLRLQSYREEVVSQSLQAPKGEAYGLAALRFLTGVETSFDVADEPLKPPDRPLLALSDYLEAARISRPEINAARAGVVARSATVRYNRAKLFPDIGLGLGADFVSTPTIPQQNLWASDGFNHFYYSVTLNVRWGLDFLPQAARTAQAESQLEESRSLERLSLETATYEVEKAYADVTAAKGREEAWGRAERLAKQWMSVAQDHIDLGTWDERSLLEPLRGYGNARIQHLYALMDVDVAVSALALVSGWDAAAPAGGERGGG